MQAQCPKCSTVFQADRSGLTFCPACGQQFSVQVTEPQAQAPAPGPSPSETTGLPWEQEKTARSFFKTLILGIKDPNTYWKSLRTEGPWLDALLFGWLVTLVMGVVNLPSVFIRSLSHEQLEQMRGYIEDLNPEAWDLLQGLVEQQVTLKLTSILSNVVLYPLFLIILAAVTHVFCLLLGAAPNRFEGTLRALAYASPPLVLVGLGWVPCFGPLLALGGLVYSGVQTIFGIQRTQKTTGFVATTVVILPSVVLCCLCCAFPAAMFFGAGALSQQG